MAGGIFGFDPLQAMLMRVQQQPQNEEQYASGGAAPSSTPLPAAPTPAPVAGPSGGGGTGISALLSTLGGAAENIASGSGIFGDTSRDAETDPSSGAPLGMVRKANGQRMMNLGVMLLAAGGRQSDDSRARILASIPGQLGDPASQLNEFAKTRLDMAKTRLIERKMLEEQEANRILNERAARMQGQNAPGSVTPSAVAPVVAAAVPGAIGQAAQATAASGRVPGPVAPLAGQPAPSAGQPAVAIPGTPAPAGPATLSVGPPKIERRIWNESMLSPTEFERYITSTREEKGKMQAEAQKMLDNQEMTTAPFIDPQSGKILTHTYKNGILSGVGNLGEGPGEMTVTDEEGRRVYRKYDVRGKLQHEEIKADPEYERQASKRLDILAKRGEELHTLHDSAVTSMDTAKKLDPLIKEVKEGKAYTGTFGGLQRYAVNALASVGGASEAQLQGLISTQRVGNITEEAANQFARMYNGAVVTDADRDSARLAIGAILTNNKDALADALEQMQKNAHKKVNEYHSKLDRHEKSLEGRVKDKDLYTSPRIDLGQSSAAAVPGKPPGKLLGRIKADGTWEGL